MCGHFVHDLMLVNVFLLKRFVCHCALRSGSAADLCEQRIYCTQAGHATAVCVTTVTRVLIGLGLEVFGRPVRLYWQYYRCKQTDGDHVGPYWICDGRIVTGRVLRVFPVIILPPLCQVRIHSAIIDARHLVLAVLLNRPYWSRINKHTQQPQTHSSFYFFLFFYFLY